MEPAPNVMGHELSAHMLWITNLPLLCLWSTVPLLACGGSRTLPSHVIAHQKPVPWSHSRFPRKSKKNPGQNLRKNAGSRKTWRMQPLKKKNEKPKENAFFSGATILQFFPDPEFFRWNRQKPKPRQNHKKKSYATGNDAMSRMFWRTNPPLQCDIWYGSIS